MEFSREYLQQKVLRAIDRNIVVYDVDAKIYEFTQFFREQNVSLAKDDNNFVLGIGKNGQVLAGSF